MKVEIRKNPEREAPALILEAAEITPAVETLAERLRAIDGGTLIGWRRDRAYPIDSGEIVRFYAMDKQVFAEDAKGERYAVKQRLYELEASLGRGFARISHGEIINLHQVKALNLKLSGTIQITMNGGAVCYASRRYVKKIREALGL